MCLDRDIKDEKSGADLKKGCHTLDGRKALAFVRQRHQEAQGDLGRTQNQQKFLAALARKAATPGTLLDPSKVYPDHERRPGHAHRGQGHGPAEPHLAVPGDEGRHRAATASGSTSPSPSLGFTHLQGQRREVEHTARPKKLFTELKQDRPVTFSEKN